MNRILLVAATELEIAPTLAYLAKEWTSAGQTVDSLSGDVPPPFASEQPSERHITHFRKDETELRVLISGVGLTATAFALGLEAQQGPYQLAMQAGVGGAIDQNLDLGQLVRVASDRFADLGAEDRDGSLISLQELDFMPEGPTSPFEADGRILPLDTRAQDEWIDLPAVQGISVNKVHGSAASIDRLRKKYPTAQVESMEGAAFFYGCRTLGWPAIQLRTISNYVEERNRDGWLIGPAIENLNKGILKFLDVLS